MFASDLGFCMFGNRLVGTKMFCRIGCVLWLCCWPLSFIDGFTIIDLNEAMVNERVFVQIEFVGRVCKYNGWRS